MRLSRLLLDNISAKHGDSFYLLDSTRFKNNFLRLASAFCIHYPQTLVAYSYKTNYIPRFCKLVSELGGYAEVVSSMEMMLALKLGVPANKIFFNGPYKEHSAVNFLQMAGGIINIDSWEELERIAQHADSYTGKPFKVGLRCNFEVDDSVFSRFGFDVNSQAFLEAIALIDEHPKLKMAGLHCHFATRSLECWKSRTKGMIEIIDRHFRHRLTDLEHVSLGGGIYGHMADELKVQFPVIIPEFEDYANVAALPFANYFRDTGINHRPTLIIEPGTALVADAMKYVCQVNSIKQVRGRTFVSLTGSSYNINPNPNRKNLPVNCFSNPDDEGRLKVSDAFLSGYTCIEGDYLYKGFNGSLSIGDFMVFDDVGAYSVVMKPPFILPNVAIVEPSSDGMKWQTIKREENFNDIFSTYFF